MKKLTETIECMQRMCLCGFVCGKWCGPGVAVGDNKREESVSRLDSQCQKKRTNLILKARKCEWRNLYQSNFYWSTEAKRRYSHVFKNLAPVKVSLKTKRSAW